MMELYLQNKFSFARVVYSSRKSNCNTPLRFACIYDDMLLYATITVLNIMLATGKIYTNYNEKEKKKRTKK